MRAVVLFRSFVCAPALVLAIAAHARAEPQALAVLGIASDDDLTVAAALTDALRYEAQSEGNFRVSDSQVSLSQMTMAQDCDIAESSCRAQIAKALGVEQVIYGDLRKKPTGGYDADLHMFAAQGGETQAHRMIAGTETERIGLRVHARALLHALEGIDEDAVSDGAEGAGAETTAAPAAATQADEEPDSAGSNDWIGYTLYGVAGVSLGLTIFSWTQIHAAAHDDDYEAYRKAVGMMKPSIRDVCDEAEAGRSYGVGADGLAKANDACNRGNTFERLQFVFIGAMLVSAGVGTYFLLDDDGVEQAKHDRTRFALQPSVHRHGASLNVRFSL
jgi:hypothetical protein